MEIQLAISHFNGFVSAQVEAMSAIKKLATLDRSLSEKLFNVSRLDATFIHQLDLSTITSIAKKNSNLFSIKIPSDDNELNHAASCPDITSFNYTSDEVKASVIHYKEAQLNAMIALKSLTDLSVQTASLLTSTSIKDCNVIHNMSLTKVIAVAQRYPWLFSLNYSARNDIFTATAEVRRHIRPFVESTVIY